jgi:hypothetical protein
MTLDTSIEAYIKFKEAGRINERQLQIFKALACSGEPDLTANEVWDWTRKNVEGAAYWKDGVTQRFSELWRDGLLIRLPKRKCKITGGKCRAWKLAPLGTPKRRKPIARDDLIQDMRDFLDALKNKDVIGRQTVIKRMITAIEIEDENKDD